MRRKPKIKYTEMAMYVDANILKEDKDIEKIYDYLQMLAYMLSVKRRFFNSEAQYDKFSLYMATIVYIRMTTPRQYLPVTDSKYLSPIKSCLNYMKQILYARKCAFCFEEYNQTVDHKLELLNNSNCGFDRSVLDNSDDILKSDINMYFSNIDKTIYGIIKSGIYKNDKKLC